MSLRAVLGSLLNTMRDRINASEGHLENLDRLELISQELYALVNIIGEPIVLAALALIEGAMFKIDCRSTKPQLVTITAPRLERQKSVKPDDKDYYSTTRFNQCHVRLFAWHCTCHGLTRQSIRQAKYMETISSPDSVYIDDDGESWGSATILEVPDTCEHILAALFQQKGIFIPKNMKRLSDSLA